MKKKYYLKSASKQPIHQEYSYQINQNILLNKNSKHSSASKMAKVRLTTDFVGDDSIEHDIQFMANLNYLKKQKLLKKSDLSLNHLKKGRYFIPPTNKQNLKNDKINPPNRFTFNQFRKSEAQQLKYRLNNDQTLCNIRNSQSRHKIKPSLQKSRANIAKLNQSKTNFRSNQLQIRNELTKKYTKQNKDIKNTNNKDIRDSKQNGDNNYNQMVNSEDQLSVEQLVGSGTFGKVYRARIRKNGKLIALKKVQQDKKYKTRQYEIVKMLDNPFIIKILGVFVQDQIKFQYLNIAMQAYTQNFFQFITSTNNISSLDMKIYLYQIFRGVNYLHSINLCHRDLKPQNILIKGKKLVICDFGSAKIMKKGQKNISYICSRCYRAPELIFQSTNYTTKIDMWSIGCILLQILHGKPLFIADSSLNHILEVIKILGTPSKDEIIAMNPTYQIECYDLPNIKGKSFKKLFPGVDHLYIDLVEKIVCYNPNERLSAIQALAHPYFDDLRDQNIFRDITGTKIIQYFFQFTIDEIPSKMRQKLIPKWWKKK